MPCKEASVLSLRFEFVSLLDKTDTEPEDLLSYFRIKACTPIGPGGESGTQEMRRLAAGVQPIDAVCVTTSCTLAGTWKFGPDTRRDAPHCRVLGARAATWCESHR